MNPASAPTKIAVCIAGTSLPDLNPFTHVIPKKKAPHNVRNFPSDRIRNAVMALTLSMTT